MNDKVEKKDSKKKKSYDFGGINEFDLEKIEAEVLNESVYLDVFAGSDARFKTNVVQMKGTLAKLFMMRGVSFDWKTDDFPNRGFTNDHQIGFIAQEVREQFPELVKEDDTGFLAVNYSKMVPVLLEGMRELHQVIEDQNALMKTMAQRLMKLENEQQVKDRELPL